jgi:hypothetical protein
MSETGINPGMRNQKYADLNEHFVRNPLVVSISQRSEKLRLYILVLTATIPNPGFKAVCLYLNA